MTKLQIPSELHYPNPTTETGFVTVGDLSGEQLELYKHSLFFHELEELYCFNDEPFYGFMSAIVDLQNRALMPEPLDLEADKDLLTNIHSLIRMFDTLHRKLKPEYRLNPDFVDALEDFTESLQGKDTQERIIEDLKTRARELEAENPEVYGRLAKLEEKSQQLRTREIDLLSSIQKLRIQNETLCQIIGKGAENDN